jgi:hypothetical protein
MTRMYEATCLRDCAQDVPYQYFREGQSYVIPEDSPMAAHFSKPVREVSEREIEKSLEEPLTRRTINVAGGKAYGDRIEGEPGIQISTGDNPLANKKATKK